MANSWPPMERRGPQVTDADITAFEASLGVGLPGDYRAFLLDVNGGRTGDEATSFRIRRDSTNLNGLHSLNHPDDLFDLGERNDLIRDDLPPDLLAVGNDDGGSRICLCIRGEHRGEVWFMDTADRRPEGSNPRVLWHDRRDFIKLADSFRAFMDGLTPL